MFWQKPCINQHNFSMTLFIPQMWLLVKYTASKATSTVSDQRISFEARESFSVLERPHWPQGKFTVAGAFLIKDWFFFPLYSHRVTIRPTKINSGFLVLSNPQLMLKFFSISNVIYSWFVQIRIQTRPIHCICL